MILENNSIQQRESVTTPRQWYQFLEMDGEEIIVQVPGNDENDHWNAEEPWHDRAEAEEPFYGQDEAEEPWYGRIDAEEVQYFELNPEESNDFIVFE